MAADVRRRIDVERGSALLSSRSTRKIVAADGKAYEVAHYNLEAILAVGFRVKSLRGTQFRRWANTQLRELIVKGFVMNDERLKNPGGWDTFDELLARIRSIRDSEKWFYHKVRDLFKLSSDYQARETETALFFAEVQNKLLHAATRKPSPPMPRTWRPSRAWRRNSGGREVGRERQIEPPGVGSLNRPPPAGRAIIRVNGFNEG